MLSCRSLASAASCHFRLASGRPAYRNYIVITSVPQCGREIPISISHVTIGQLLVTGKLGDQLWTSFIVSLVFKLNKICATAFRVQRMVNATAVRPFRSALPTLLCMELVSIELFNIKNWSKNVTFFIWNMQIKSLNRSVSATHTNNRPNMCCGYWPGYWVWKHVPNLPNIDVTFRSA